MQRTAAPLIQRRPVRGGSATMLPPQLAAFGNLPARPLPAAVLQQMERAFNTSFRDVRVHVTPQVQALGATALTHGTSLYFAPGHYNPQTPHGRQLLAHELAHVVQQRARRVTNPFGSGTAVVVDSVLEAEAERRGREATTVQPLMSHVMSYLRHHPDAGLDGVNYETVKAYVENESANPIHRRAIWHAWHQRGTRKQQRQTREIALPEDLEPKNLLKPAVAVDLSGWDSDDEAIDIGGSLRAVPVVTLFAVMARRRRSNASTVPPSSSSEGRSQKRGFAARSGCRLSETTATVTSSSSIRPARKTSTRTR